jgi:PAS domain S-box-containing protein
VVEGDAPELRADVLPDESADDLYEDAPCGYLTTGVDGTVLRANRTFLALAGRSEEEVVGRLRFYDLLPAGAKIYYETHYWPLLQMQGSVREIALELLRPDRSRVPVLVNATVKRDDGGAPTLVRVTVFDATERRRYERELVRARAEAEERAAAAAALQHVAEGVVLLDEAGRVRAANPAAARILDLQLDAAADAPLAERVPGWAALALRVPVGAAGQPVSPVVVPLVVGEATRWLQASAERARDGVVYTIRDVTEERRLEDMRSDIVAVVSHELRTPLAGVFGAAQTLLAHGDALGDDDRRSFVEMIAEQSARLARIVDEILLAQRLERGDVPIEQRSLDLAALVETLVERTRSWRNTRPVALTVDGPLYVLGDAGMLEQAVTNLLDNAMKYSPAGSEVDVRVERTRAAGRVLVADRGPGVPISERERIFEKFLRLDPEQLSGVPGTGLGLHIARELVRRMHGQLGMLDDGDGATFYVDVPLDSARSVG